MLDAYPVGTHDRPLRNIGSNLDTPAALAGVPTSVLQKDQIMPKQISTGDPIFAALALPSAFLHDVVDLINRSQSLLGEIDQLDATTLPGGGTAEIESQSGQQNGGNTTCHASVINIAAFGSYDDAKVPYGGGSLAAGQTEGLTPAGVFVGILAHEIAHWGDAQLGPLYSAGVLPSYTLEQSVATEFASEGKAATSQYTAMSQIQASEAAQPIPAGMANGNVLFDVNGHPPQDSVLLQHVQSIGVGAGSHAADISYFGSQFWNVAVDGGTYLTTMWGGYGAAGARNDLGIDEARIVQYQVSENDSGTLAGCTIETSASSGQTGQPSVAALTYRIAFAAAGSQQARITDTATGAAVATVDTVVTSAGGTVQFSIVADAFTFAVIDDTVATVRGDRDTLTLGSRDSLFLTGSGNTVTGAAGNMISLSASSSAVIATQHGGGTISLDGDAATLEVLGSGAAVGLLGNSDAAVASGSTVTLAASIAGSLGGSDDIVILGAGDTLSLTGDRDTIVLSGVPSGVPSGVLSGVLAGGDGAGQSITLSGSQDRLFGGSHPAELRLTLSGAASTVVLTGGHATISGAGVGTTVFGGGSDVEYGGGDGILVMGSGAATVAGAAEGARETVFGGASGLLYQGGREYADVVGGAGSCTIRAGVGGGWYGGSIAGNNFLAATGAGTVLAAGGGGDTLVGATGGGAYLIAAAGNETLRGGNQTGESTVFLGSGADLLVAGPGGSIVDTGAGTVTLYGGGGHDHVWAGSGDGDVFVTGVGGQLEIHGFRTGADHLLSAGQAVGDAVRTGDGTLFTLSSGATIILAGVDAPPGTAFA